MNDEDRALRALTLEVISELRPIMSWWQDSTRHAWRRECPEFSERVEPILARLLPGIAGDLPTYDEYVAVFDRSPDVIEDPGLLDGFSPRRDPFVVLRALLKTYRAPIWLTTSPFYAAVRERYKPLHDEDVRRAQATACS